MTLTSKTVILRWNSNGDLWYIRGIDADGFFYGEIQKKRGDSSVLINVEGRLSSDENALLRRLVVEINAYDRELRIGSEEYEGLLAIGHISSPEVLLKYSSATSNVLELSSKFKQIIELIAPYLKET